MTTLLNIYPRWLSVRLLAWGVAAILAPISLKAQKELVISGYATQQGMEDLEEVPASGVSIRVYDDEGLVFTENTGISGSFYFKLPIGSDYLVEWTKPGLTSKRMLFNLIGLKEGDLKRSDLKFEMDIGLLEAAYLTKELKNEGGVTQVRWSHKHEEWEYDNAQREDFWQKYEVLQDQYELAKKDSKSNRVGQLLYDMKEKVVWPDDPGDSVTVFVLDDYGTYVQMKMLQEQNSEYAKADVNLIEGIDDLKKKQRFKQPDILYATYQSGVTNEELAKAVGDKPLLVTEGMGVSKSMINIENTLYESKIQINDIEFIKRGFTPTEELRQAAETTTDKKELASVMADAQQTLKSEKERASKMEDEKAAIERQKKTLEIMNQGLYKAKGELDSALRFKSLQVDLLESNIANREKVLQRLNAQMSERNRQLTEAQALFDQRQSDLENTVANLATKEKKLLEVDEMLAATSAEFKRQEANLSEYVDLLEDQKKLTVFITAALGLITVFLILAYRNYRKQKQYAFENHLQAERIELQRMLLEEKNTEMNDSITYAKRIQDSLLPGMEELNRVFKESLLIYQPKDVVAGDFFWIQKKGSVVYFAVADCTGHGVPGAMMSIVCHTALNRSLRELPNPTPAQLLDLAREYVIEQVAASRDDVKDGMDIALCKWDSTTKTIEFAGAQNPLWVVTGREIEGLPRVVKKADLRTRNVYEVKGDKQPIGVYEFARPFTNHSVTLQEGDTVYIFSDGFADQFGGKNGKKMKYSLFRELLVISGETEFASQREFLSEYFLNWRGELDQIDDVCVMGIRV